MPWQPTQRRIDPSFEAFEIEEVTISGTSIPQLNGYTATFSKCHRYIRIGTNPALKGTPYWCYFNRLGKAPAVCTKCSPDPRQIQRVIAIETIDTKNLSSWLRRAIAKEHFATRTRIVRGMVLRSYIRDVLKEYSPDYAAIKNEDANSNISSSSRSSSPELHETHSLRNSVMREENTSRLSVRPSATTAHEDGRNMYDLRRPRPALPGISEASDSDVDDRSFAPVDPSPSSKQPLSPTGTVELETMQPRAARIEEEEVTSTSNAYEDLSAAAATARAPRPIWSLRNRLRKAAIRAQPSTPQSIEQEPTPDPSIPQQPLDAMIQAAEQAASSGMSFVQDMRKFAKALKHAKELAEANMEGYAEAVAEQHVV